MVGPQIYFNYLCWAAMLPTLRTTGLKSSNTSKNLGKTLSF